MKKLRTLLISTSGLVLAFGLSPSIALAFSAYGAGTSGNPFRIATCAQLQEMENDLGAYYKLVANIDCSSVSDFSSIGGSFTGTLDGQNHTISNLAIVSDRGLFDTLDGATISNITIDSGTLTGSNTMGSFAGSSTDSSLDNLHSAMTITATGAYIGGLVGSSKDATIINKSSYSGTLTGTGTSYIGGLIGYQGDLSTPTADVLSNSYFSGTLNLSGMGGYVGGAMGIIYSGTVQNSYSSGTINISGTYTYLGGLIGITYKGATNNSFSATYITGTGTNFGAFFGIFYTGSGNTSTRSNNYYDSYRANGNDAYSRNCAALDEGSGNCTAVNSANATPNYFKNNNTSEPLDHVSWDFVDEWQTTSTYPTLSSLSNFVDPTVPNSGDANGDGTLDSYQARVASVLNADDAWSTVEVPSSGGCTLENPQSVNANGLKVDSGFTQQLTTMTSFEIYCPTAGATVAVTIIYDKLYDISNSVLRHYNATTSTYSTVTGTVFGTRTVGGVVKTTVTYNITDGGAYDTDSTANGIIMDPVGFSVPPSTNTGLERSSNNPIIAVMIVGVLLATAGLYGKRRKA